MNCVRCDAEFNPKPMGHNARYCSPRCKRRAQVERLREANPESFKVRRMRSYSQTKKHPDRMERHRKRSRDYRDKAREWLAAYKMSHGCVDCGYRQHHSALQLDHEGPKAVSIADARSSIARLKAEIATGKCKVRCANCHSIKTWERKQAAKLEPTDHGNVGRGCE